MSKLEVTEVFDWNWSAMNLKAYNVIITENEISFLIYNEYEQDYIVDKTILKSEIDLDKYKVEVYETITYLTDINELKEYPEYLIKRYKYIVNEGSSRSSKTATLIDCVHLYAEANKGKRCTIWRDTKTDCKKTVLVDMVKHLKRTNRFFKPKFNKTESIFTYKNGSSVEIHGTDDEETVHGLTQDIAWLNEPYKIGVDTFDQIDQRTSDFVFIDWNPKKDSWIDDVKKKPNAITIKSTFKNNFFCPLDQKDKLLGYQTVKQSNAVISGQLELIEAFNYNTKLNDKNLNEKDLKELKRCIENEKQNSANEFKWSVYGLGEKGERPHRIYHWNECNYLDYLNLEIEEWFGCDWGKVDPWAIIGCKYDRNTNRLYVHQYLHQSEDNIIKKLDNETKRRIKQDGEEGLVNYMFKYLNIDLKSKIVCDSNRPLKVEQLRRFGYENAVVAENEQKRILDGIELLDYGVDVYFTNTSDKIKEEQEEYSWKVDRYNKVLEEPEGGKDHSLDAIKYCARKMQAYGIIKKV